MPEVWKKWEGQVVNEEFQLLRYLGGSEHSAVFLTKRADREPHEVAIKLILANAENPELQLSWWELAAKLSHPHLLRLFQRGHCQLDGMELLYAVTECAEESLAQIIPYRPLTPAEARDMLQSVLDALAYVHGKGFVHGHIKPANIMAVGDQIKVSSDGLCGAGESSRVLGTPSIYTALEIAGGGGMSPASDVWSLGMTLVEALTQHPPVWERTEQAELVLPPTLPEPFFDIASHCLRRNPQRRWTVAEIAARLQQTSLAPQRQETARPRNALVKWGYMVPAIASGLLLLAILGSRLLHRHTSAEPSSAVESSKQQAEPQQRVDAGQSAQVTRDRDKDKEQALSIPAPSNASPVAAKKSSAKNAVDTSSAGDPAHGAVVQQVSPDVSRNALRTIHGKLKVRVTVAVDSSGSVVLAKFDSRGPSRYFADRALQAARRWTFKPPQVDGQGVPSEWILKFEFSRSETNVYPAQTAP
ncbi:MAG TPA: TonB family protein [Terriglobales bacterium]|nr:TonB family protein [Terriglobales bacterium]